jgi:hypothetical protein
MTSHCTRGKSRGWDPRSEERERRAKTETKTRTSDDRIQRERETKEVQDEDVLGTGTETRERRVEGARSMIQTRDGTAARISTFRLARTRKKEKKREERRRKGAITPNIECEGDEIFTKR